MLDVVYVVVTVLFFLAVAMLAKGMDRLGGNETDPVPPPAEDRIDAGTVIGR
ncbi:MAG TPA: hypothetical protein VFQ15_00805 [Jiangellaceae bacterium]|jgi:hypothetical protein|nr:hypothetical protein [Jiangellaceae bacterium]